MSGEARGGVRVREKNPPTGVDAVAKPVTWRAFDGRYPMRLRQELGRDDAAGVAFGFTYDGMLFAQRGGVYCEVSIADVCESLRERLEGGDG